jgi:Tripartite tricarboxylate transporter TctB family
VASGQGARGERAAGIVLLAFSLCYLYLAAYYPYGMVRGVPGPGMLPLLLGAVLFLLSLAYTRRSFLRKVEKKHASPPLGPLAFCLALFYAYVTAFPWLGFLLSNFIFGIFTLKFLFKLGWRPALLHSLALTAVFHVGFYNVLGVPLPLGLAAKMFELLKPLGIG